MLQITSNKCEPDQISEKNTSLQLSNKLTNKRQLFIFVIVNQANADSKMNEKAGWSFAISKLS